AARVTGASRAVTIAAAAVPRSTRIAGTPARRVALGVAAFLLPFAVWWLLLLVSGLSPIIAKTPVGVIDYLFFSPAAPKAQSRLLAALAETLPLTLLGMAAGLGFAFLLAVLGAIRPAIVSGFMPVALVTQTMPL